MPVGDVKITVLTPTFNRAHLLPRLYASLSRQTFGDFEWRIIDDGSTDDTRALVAEWSDAPFPIRYLFQENRGTKVAWNVGVELAEGELLAVIGSDDYYVPQALELLLDGWSGLDDRWVSVNGRTMTPNGDLNGPPFTDVLDIDSMSYWYRRRLAGDTAGLSRTDIVRRYPFPYATWRSAPEAIAFNRIARRYLTRFLPEPVAIVDYQPDGLSARSRAESVAEPRPHLVYNWEAALFPRWLPLRVRARFAANCVRFGARTIAHRYRLGVTEARS
jgi:glycosyltransferase involved in cell wall biosynthesis